MYDWRVSLLFIIIIFFKFPFAYPAMGNMCYLSKRDFIPKQTPKFIFLVSCFDKKTKIDIFLFRQVMSNQVDQPKKNNEITIKTSFSRWSDDSTLTLNGVRSIYLRWSLIQDGPSFNHSSFVRSSRPQRVSTWFFFFIYF